MDHPRIVICYDGSSAAKHAVEQAAKLLPGATATILTAWRPMQSFAVAWTALASVDDVDTDIERDAHRTASEGARLARAAGLVATEAVLRVPGSVGSALLDWCARQELDLVVLGSSGRSAVSDILSGSVASHVLHHADVPVLVVRDQTLARSPVRAVRAAAHANA